MSGHPAAGAGPTSAHHEEQYQPVFVGPIKARLEALFPQYPTRQACLLPALWMVWKETSHGNTLGSWAKMDGTSLR